MVKKLNPKDLELTIKAILSNYADDVIPDVKDAVDEVSEEAKDLVQDLFFYIWDHADSLLIKTTMKAYLFTS